MLQGFDDIERDCHGECHRERGEERPVPCWYYTVQWLCMVSTYSMYCTRTVYCTHRTVVYVLYCVSYVYTVMSMWSQSPIIPISDIFIPRVDKSRECKDPTFFHDEIGIDASRASGTHIAPTAAGCVPFALHSLESKSGHHTAFEQCGIGAGTRDE
jgi:hypothetical protein